MEIMKDNKNTKGNNEGLQEHKTEIIKDNKNAKWK